MESEFQVFLEGRKEIPERIEFAINAVKDFEGYLRKKNVALEEAELGVLKEYISLLISEGRNLEDRLVAIARYCRFVKKNDYFIYIAGIVNGREVLLGIAKDLERQRVRKFGSGSSKELSYRRLGRRKKRTLFLLK